MNQDQKGWEKIIGEIFSKSFLPIAVYSRDWTFIGSNKNYNVLTGYNAEELSGMDMVKDLTAISWRQGERKHLERILESRFPIHYTKTILHKNGHEIPIETTCGCIRIEGGTVRYYYSLVTKVESEEIFKAPEEKGAEVKTAQIPLSPIEQLLQELKEGDFDARLRAVTELGQRKNQEAVEALIEALSDYSRNIRMNAALSLGEIGDTQALPPLIKVLSDSSNNVRWGAAIALGNLGDNQAVDSLTYASRDRDIDVRRASREAQMKIKKNNPK